MISAAAIERELIAACAELHLVASDWDATRRGLDDSKRGIPAARYDASHQGYRPDDGRPDNDPGGPDPIARADEAERDELNARRATEIIRREVRNLLIIRSNHRRSGLPRDHADRVPTPEERKSAEDETIDDTTGCSSCARIGAFSPRYRRDLCSWCLRVVDDPEWKVWWPQMDKPPVLLVRMHHEAFMRGENVTEEQKLAELKRCYGEPRKVPAAG